MDPSLSQPGARVTSLTGQSNHTPQCTCACGPLSLTQLLWTLAGVPVLPLTAPIRPSPCKPPAHSSRQGASVR